MLDVRPKKTTATSDIILIIYDDCLALVGPRLLFFVGSPNYCGIEQQTLRSWVTSMFNWEVCFKIMKTI